MRKNKNNNEWFKCEQQDIEGEKGKGGGGGSSAKEDPNTLSSRAIVRTLELVSAGEIEGFVTGDAQSIYFDNTPVQNPDSSFNFTNVSYDIRYGLPSQPYMSGFPSAETVKDLGTTLTASSPVVAQISQTDIDAVRITIQFPQGLKKQDTDDGDLHGSKVTVAFDVRLDSDGYWQNVATRTIDGKNTQAFEREYRIERPAGTGLWSFRVRRLTADSTSAALVNNTIVSRYTEIQDVKLEYNNFAYVGIAVNAESASNSVPNIGFLLDGIICQVPNNYDPITRTYSGQWTGTFKRAWTNNPAWVLYDLLTNERYGAKIDASTVDKFSFYDAAVYNDQYVLTGKIPMPEGGIIRQSDGAIVDANGVLLLTPESGVTEPRYRFNTVIQSRESAIKVLNAVAGTMRATLMVSGDIIWVNQDRPSNYLKIVSNANVKDGKFTYSSSALQERHTVAVVTWNDPSNKYAATLATVENEDAIEKFGYYPIEIAAYGATSEGQAIRAGKWQLDTELTTTEVVTYEASFDHFDLRVGEVVKLWDKHYTAKEGSGRIKSANNATVTLDRPITIGENAVIEVVLADGKTMQSLPIVETNGTYSTVTVDGNWSILPLPDQTIYAIYDSVEPRLFRITDLVQDGQWVKVTAIRYDPNKYERIENGITVEPPVYSAIKSTVALPPTNIAVEPSAYIDPLLGRQIKLIFTWDNAESAYTMGYDIKWRINSGAYVSDFSTCNYFEIPNAVAGTYDLLITTLNLEGKRSATASYTYTHDYQGSNSLVPPTSIYLVDGHGTGTSFIGNHLFVAWDTNAANQLLLNQRVGGYQVDVFDAVSGTKLRTETTEYNVTQYDYTAEKMAKDNGPYRSIRIDVYTLDAYMRPSASCITQTFTNSAPAIPNNIQVTAIAGGLMVTYDKPTETDYAGTIVWLSETNGFSPSSSTVVFDGDSTLVTLSNLDETKTYYLRLAAYDSFGKNYDGTALNVSGQVSVVPLMADGIARVSTLPPTAADDAIVYNTTDGKLYRYFDGAWTAATDGADIIANSITAGKLALAELITTQAQIANEVVTNSHILNATIENAKIKSISADKITTGNLAVGTTITVGSGVSISSDGYIVSDGASKQTVMSNGDVITYKKAGGNLYPYQSLNHVEMGQATNGTQVVIPGYFNSQPAVLVSPANLQFYNPTYSAQAQSVNCATGAITETSAGSMRWAFTPTATLNLAAATATVVVNAGSGDVSANSWTSSNYTTPANCTSISPTVQLRSSRGNGSSQYLYRSIRWRVEYYNGSWITTDGWRVVDMGAQTSSAITDSKTFTFPSSGTWTWRIYTEAYDTNGSVFGSVQYSYSSTVVSGSASVATTDYPNTGTTTKKIATPITFGAATGSGEIYQVTYAWNVTLSETSSSTPRAYAGWTTPSGASPSSMGQTITYPETYTFSGSLTTSGSSYSTTLTGYLWEASPSQYYSSYAQTRFTLNSASATIYRRTIIPNTTTPVNNSYITSYGYSLSTAQILATGTLNWMAVGQ